MQPSEPSGLAGAIQRVGLRASVEAGLLDGNETRTGKLNGFHFYYYYCCYSYGMIQALIARSLLTMF